MKRAVLEAPITAWAVALGKDVKTLEKIWLRAGFKKPKRGERLRALDVFRCVTGDLTVAKIRQANADAELSEIKAKRARNEVIPHDDVRLYITSSFSPIRQDIIDLPALVSAEANPANPEVARAALVRWGDNFLLRRRENLPTFETTKD